MAEDEAEGESTRLLDLTRVLLITAAGTRAGISDRVQHLHQFSDSFVLRRYLGRILPGDLAGDAGRCPASSRAPRTRGWRRLSAARRSPSR